MKSTNEVEKVVAIAIGAAITFILMKFVVIPTPIPNTVIQTSYGFLALLAAIYGGGVAAIAGFIAHFLNDAMTYGTVWYAWVVTTAFIGLGFGFILKGNKIQQGIFNRASQIKFLVGQLIVNVLGWGLIAPVLDILIHSEPANKVFTQGIVSAITNSIATAIVGWLLIQAYTKTRTKSGSLRED